MIANVHQYHVTLGQIKRFEGALDSIRSQPKPEEIHDLIWKSLKDGYQSMVEELRKEVEVYEKENQTNKG